MKILLSIFFSLFLTINLCAQNYTFHQFHESPLNLSPALAGSNCGSEFLINFRNQSFGSIQGGGGVSFRTLSASYDKPIELKNGDKIGWGFRLGFNDVSVTNIRSVLASLAFSYQKRISPEDAKPQYITGGFDLGVGQLSADIFSTGGTARDSDIFTDLSFGLGYKIELDSRNNIQVGGALTHLHQPEVVFETIGSLGEIESRLNLYAIAGFPISPRIDIRPRIFYTRGNQSEISTTAATVGARLAGVIHQFELSAGVITVNDGFNDNVANLILGATYFYNNFGIMVSRELNTSTLNTVNLGSVTEATIIYRPCQKEWVDKWDIDDL